MLMMTVFTENKKKSGKQWAAVHLHNFDKRYKQKVMFTHDMMPLSYVETDESEYELA